MPRQESVVAARLELPGIGLCSARTWEPLSLSLSLSLSPAAAAPSPAALPLSPGRGSAGGGGDKARTGARRTGGRAPLTAPPRPPLRAGHARGRPAPLGAEPGPGEA